MQRIVYYVAMSLDGYIAGPGEDISAFIQSGPAVDQYFQDLQQFKTVIMGRKTYEFGYQFGLEPGKLAYPHMKHYIFSSNMTLDQQDENLEIVSIAVEEVIRIKNEASSDIYLCGGGTFAGWLLKNNLLDELKIKLNPIILGGGTPLFEGVGNIQKWKTVDTRSFEDGINIITYKRNT